MAIHFTFKDEMICYFHAHTTLESKANVFCSKSPCIAAKLRYVTSSSEKRYTCSSEFTTMTITKLNESSHSTGNKCETLSYDVHRHFLGFTSRVKAFKSHVILIQLGAFTEAIEQMKTGQSEAKTPFVQQDELLTNKLLLFGHKQTTIMLDAFTVFTCYIGIIIQYHQPSE